MGKVILVCVLEVEVEVKDDEVVVVVVVVVVLEKVVAVVVVRAGAPRLQLFRISLYLQSTHLPTLPPR